MHDFPFKKEEKKYVGWIFQNLPIKMCAVWWAASQRGATLQTVGEAAHQQFKHEEEKKAVEKSWTVKSHRIVKGRREMETVCVEPSTGVVCENRYTNARDAFYTRRRDGSSWRVDWKLPPSVDIIHDTGCCCSPASSNSTDTIWETPSSGIVTP